MLLLFFAALVTTILPVQSAEPNRQPELASSPGLTALVFSSGNSIWFSASHDNGQSFSPSIEVAKVPALAVGRHRGPRIAISGETIVVSAVYGQSVAAGPHAHGLPANGDLAAWRSTDGGRTWSDPVVINDVSGAAREGLHAMTAGENGEIGTVWLDLRSSGTQLYGAFSKNHGLTWSKNVPIYQSKDGTICQCCHPSLVSSGKHQFEAMFRNVVGDARDMYVINWKINGQISQPVKTGNSSWNINACPMDGGGIARQGDTTVTAWRRDRTVFLQRVGQNELSLGEGKDVSIAATPGGPYVAWTGSSGIELFRPGQNAKERLSSSGGFPVLTALANGWVLAAWEQSGGIQLKAIH